MKKTEPVTADTAEIVLAATQMAALARLHHAVESHGGAAVLCGPAGAGKTTVLAHLVKLVPPDAVRIIDDAHLLDDNAIEEIAADAAAGRPATIILSGQGRLLSLVGRSGRLESQVRLRAVVGPLAREESRSLAIRMLADGAGTAAHDDRTLDTIHEIAGGLPRGVVRLARLARLLLETDPTRPLVPMDIERIHSRLLADAA